MPPSLAKNWGMPNKDRSFHESPEKAGGEGWLRSLLGIPEVIARLDGVPSLLM